MNTPALQSFLESCRRRRCGEMDDALQESTAAFMQAAAEDPALLSAAAEALREMPIAGGSWMAVAFGAAVERGSDVDLTGPDLIDYFKNCLQMNWSIPSEDNEDVPPESDTEEEESQSAMADLCRGVVAHLARMHNVRLAMGRDEPLLSRLSELEPCVSGIMWVREAVMIASGTLVVLQPASRRGVRVRYENIGNCFHLFTLFQQAIGTRLPGGRAPQSSMKAAALGSAPPSISDEAWWHYGDPRCPQASVAASIWGEMPVRAIPFVDQEQVMLIWPPILGNRSWSGGFFGPRLDALPAVVTLDRELSADECEAMLQRLDIKPQANADNPQIKNTSPMTGPDVGAKKKPWWKFWA